MNLRKRISELKSIIDKTDFSRLENLKVSIQISDLHPVLKEACLVDIDRKQNRSVYHGLALAECSELCEGEI